MDVYISCPRGHDAHALKLAEALRERGLSAWYSRADLMPGESLSERISQSLSQARAVVFLIAGEDSLSDWQQKEYMTALECSWSDPKKVLLPVLLGTADSPAFLADRQPLRIKGVTADWSKVAEVVARQVNHGPAVRASRVLVNERKSRLSAIEKSAVALRSASETLTKPDKGRSGRAQHKSKAKQVRRAG
jgi:hypothetical protein